MRALGWLCVYFSIAIFIKCCRNSNHYGIHKASPELLEKLNIQLSLHGKNTMRTPEENSDLSLIHDKFSEVLKDIKLELQFQTCKNILYDLRSVKDYHTAYNWLCRTFAKLSKKYLEQFQLFHGDPKQAYQQLTDYLLKHGNIKVANSLFKTQMENNTLNKKFCNKLLESILDSIFIVRHHKIKVAETLKSNIDNIYKECCQEKCEGDEYLKQHHCYLDTTTTAYLRIAPTKIEVLHIDPFVAYYHEMIYPKEMKAVFKNFKLNMKPSKISDTATVNNEIRSSSYSPLGPGYAKFVKILNARINTATNLDTKNQQYELLRYNIGEKYIPHYDFELPRNATWDRRLTTSIIFLHNAIKGGYTIFPYLELTVKPVLGSMLIWRNLHESLEPDFRTLHAGCPVNNGAKWIIVTRIHNMGQEFRKPCGLVYDSYKSYDFECQ